jgi:hypothetical protein
MCCTAPDPRSAHDEQPCNKLACMLDPIAVKCSVKAAHVSLDSVWQVKFLSLNNMAASIARACIPSHTLPVHSCRCGLAAGHVHQASHPRLHCKVLHLLPAGPCSPPRGAGTPEGHRTSTACGPRRPPQQPPPAGHVTHRRQHCRGAESWHPHLAHISLRQWPAACACSLQQLQHGSQQDGS